MLLLQSHLPTCRTLDIILPIIPLHNHRHQELIPGLWTPETPDIFQGIALHPRAETLCMPLEAINQLQHDLQYLQSRPVVHTQMLEGILSVTLVTAPARVTRIPELAIDEIGELATMAIMHDSVTNAASTVKVHMATALSSWNIVQPGSR